MESKSSTMVVREGYFGLKISPQRQVLLHIERGTPSFEISLYEKFLAKHLYVLRSLALEGYTFGPVVRRWLKYEK